MDEIDPDFEPQDRPRSCTWPLRRPEFLDKKPSQPAGDQQGQGAPQTSVPEEQVPTQAVASPQIPNESKVDLTTPTTQRKNGSRRNAWGNLSYADLITKAIQGAPEQRLTLAQIYEWMVKNVPFFKDKGDSNSSAGWKNSIRHNLSLHSRFVRVQNEGTGKSSWWMINPDAKPGKSSRRRSQSMETSNPKWDKKRGRAKKKAEEKPKNCYANPSPKIEGADDQNSLPYSFGDLRSRTSSNASSCGRLSPIMAREDMADMHDREVPPMSPIPFVEHIEPSHPFDTDSSHSAADLANLAQLSLNPGINSPLHVEQLPVPGPFPANGAGGHYHTGNGASNGNGYTMYSPSPSYSTSELSPGQSAVPSPYNALTAPPTPVMSPINQPPQQQHQCSPSGDHSNSFISRPSGVLPPSAPVLTTELISRSHPPIMPVAASLLNCREESNIRQSNLHRFVVPGQSPLTTTNQLPNGRGPQIVGGILPQFQYPVPTTMAGSSPERGGMCGSIPNDLNNLELTGSSFEYDFDSVINEMAQGDGFSNMSFENINTGNTAQSATMGTNWVH